MGVPRFVPHYRSYAMIWHRAAIDIEDEGLWAVSRFISELTRRLEQTEQRQRCLEVRLAAMQQAHQGLKNTSQTQCFASLNEQDTEEVDTPAKVELNEETEHEPVAEDLQLVSRYKQLMQACTKYSSNDMQLGMYLLAEWNNSHAQQPRCRPRCTIQQSHKKA